MVSVYGLNDTLGNITYYDSSGQSEYNFTKPYSEETAQKIDKEISLIIEAQYQRACDILKKNKEKLTDLANRLLDKEVIFKDDLVSILGERPFEETPAAPPKSTKTRKAGTKQTDEKNKLD